MGAPPSFDTQRLIWAGHHALVELADNELVGHFYLELLDTAEALIVDVVFPTAGIEGDQERQRIATHASMFVAVADGNVEAARHHAELVRLVSGRCASLGDTLSTERAGRAWPEVVVVQRPTGFP